MSPQITGGDALAWALESIGLDTLYAVPGGQLDHFFDAIQRMGPNRIRLLRPRHEQAAAYMAFGHARSTGTVGAYCVVPGPGVLNTLAALSTAWATSSPVLCISGQVPTHAIGSGAGYLHEIPDQLGILARLTRFAERIESPQSTGACIHKAMAAMLSGRPRPVSVEMPMDVMSESSVVSDIGQFVRPVVKAPDAGQIEEAAKRLASARRPLIYVGSGALDASQEITQLSALLGAPVGAFRSGRGVLDSRNPLSLVFPAARRAWAEADVVLAIGTRLKYPQMYWGLDESLKVIRVDLDPEEFDRHQSPEIAIEADARLTTLALAEALTRHEMQINRNWTARISDIRQGVEGEISQHLSVQLPWLSAIRQAVPEEGILVDEITQMGYCSWYAYPVYGPRSLVTAGYQGTLGYGFATALGVAVANPDRPVVSINGDGGYLYTANEWATAMEYGIPLVAVVFNDNRYANVYRQQKEWFDERFIAADLVNPDFVAHARSFGVLAERATTPNELQKLIREAIERREPRLIEVSLPADMPTPWRFIIEPPVRGDAAERNL